jgi:hypothetical protein
MEFHDLKATADLVEMEERFPPRRKLVSLPCKGFSLSRELVKVRRNRQWMHVPVPREVTLVPSLNPMGTRLMVHV